MPPRALLPLSALGLCLSALSPLTKAAPVSTQSPTGLSVRFDAAAGRYSVELPGTKWSYAGALAAPTGAAVATQGTDAIGPYHQIAFAAGANGQSGYIRAYDAEKAVLFSLKVEKTLPSAALKFPDFTAFPHDLSVFSYKKDTFGPFSFTAEANATPWLFFDHSGKAVVVSPASHAMIATMLGDAKSELGSGLNAGVADLPPGFEQQTLLAFGDGINATWDTWGHALVRLGGKTPPANDADIGLRYLGYWTDQGASYYYRYDATKGYAGTLVDLVQHYRDRQIPIRYMQLDSWWYYKTLTDPFGKEGTSRNPALPVGEWNRYGGLDKYTAHPFVMPQGLDGFQKQIGLPLITHDRWVDINSPYRKKYTISGVAAIDPRWWAEVMGYASHAGVVTFEQDWLNIIYDDSPQLGKGLREGDQFTDSMSAAAHDNHMSVQYCMVLPLHLLQGSRYSNVTTVRVSIDRFGRGTWDAFLFGSRFAKSVGIWPWTDVFMSTELDNLTLATLSAGMVGIGDQKGAESKENLMLAARADGVLVKPDETLVPADAVYQNESDSKHLPSMIAWTQTSHGDRRTVYVFTYGRRPAGTESADFAPSDFGLTGNVYLFDPRSGQGAFQSAATKVTTLASYDSGNYRIIVPVSASGIAFLGDQGKIVPDGKKRIPHVVDNGRSIRAEVLLAASEKKIILYGFAPTAPRVTAASGTVTPVTYDPSSGRFTVEVSPDLQRAASGDEDPTRSVQIQIFPGK